jgi:hypothetical protein
MRMLTDADRMSLKRAIERLFREFPDEPPEVVAEFEWGDYGDAIESFKMAGGNWTDDFVMHNRSVIGFVNEPAYLYLLPRFIRASFTNMTIAWDILEYVLDSLVDRLRPQAVGKNPVPLTVRQVRALDDVLGCIVVCLSDDHLALIRRVEWIRSQLHNS